MNRRNFLKKAAAAGGILSMPSIIPASALGLDGHVAPSNRIALGFVGVGDHGYHVNLSNFARNTSNHAQIAMICDVDLNRVGDVRRMAEADFGIKLADKYCQQDFREVIGRDDIDAVVISTPDHWHVPLSLMALKKGKHVFCEKPTRSIAEGEILEDAVAKSGLVYQTGIEDRSVPAYMRMMDLANNGHLGEITAAYTGVPKAYHNAPLREEPIPHGLDWQMWLGPARDAPYQAARCKFHFRWVKDYGIGIISDWGTHTFDMARKIAVGDDALPVSVELLKQPLFMDSLYNTAYDFAIAYTYPNGVKIFLDTGETYVRVEGTKGWIESPTFSHPFKASSREILDAFVKAGETHYRSEPLMEHRNFIDAIKCGKPVYMPAHAEKTLCFPLHAGSIAMDLGRNLKIENGVFVDDEKANAMAKVEYRDLWKI